MCILVYGILLNESHKEHSKNAEEEVDPSGLLMCSIYALNRHTGLYAFFFFACQVFIVKAHAVRCA